MGPKELAAQFAKKNAESDARKEKEKAAAEESAAKLKKGREDAKKALADVAIPFLNEVKAELPPGQFAVGSEVDVSDQRPIAIRFKIGNGPTVRISTTSGNVTITETSSPEIPGHISFMYPGTAEPFISTTKDLTKEKLNKLVEMVIAKL
jgi:hypothetical protein